MKKHHDGFAVIEIITITALVLIIAIAGWYISARNQTKNSNNRQPDLSSTRTIQENNQKVVINFTACAPDRRRFDVSFGSTTIVVQGNNNNICELAYGSEIENPNWDGKLNTKCKVPTSLGQKEFPKGQSGIDFSAIQQYCSS